MNASHTMIICGDGERPLGELTVEEVETTLRTWRLMNRITAERADAMLATSLNWFEALCERLPGNSEAFRAMLDEATEGAHRWSAERWKDESILEARIAELRPAAIEPLFDDED